MMRLAKNLGLAAAVLGLVALAAGQSRAGVVFSQGFETDNSGWDFSPTIPDVTRVSSGTHGVTSETGSFHAEVSSGGGITNWGGYSSVFPTGGYTTSVGIYLDLAQTAANDTRFDFSSAISNTGGTHLRDFAFNAGFYNDGAGNIDRFIISASNTTGRANSYPKNSGRDPFVITQTGWYDFQQRFYDDGSGVLAVDLSIIDHTTSNVLKTWTLSNSADLIGSVVGGNRYGWFASNEFSYLAIDDTSLTNQLTAVPEPSTLISGGIAVVLCLGLGLRRRKTARVVA